MYDSKPNTKNIHRMYMKRILLLLMSCACLTIAEAQQGGGGGGTGGNGNGGNGGGDSGMNGGGTGDSGNSSSVGSASATGYSQSSGDSTVTGAVYTSTNSDENAVQITGGTFTMTDCTVTKSGGDTSDSDGSSFYGINSAVYCAGSSSVLNISGGTVTTSAAGANGIMAYNYGTINATDVTVTTSSNLSRGIHATGGGVINATNLTITTSKTNCSVIATDRGGGTVTVNGGTYTTTGDDSAITYSTGTITANGITGSSANGEIGVIEGDNSITLNNCDMTSGSASRGLMILQSGSGDSEGYNGTITVNGGQLTLTDSSTPLLEVPTDITATLTLKDVTLTIPGNVLMYVDYNTRWTTYGGTGNLVLSTDSAWTYTGDVNADEYSTAVVTVEEGVTWNGAMDSGDEAASTTATVNGVWNLTGDSYVDNLTVNEGATVNTCGYTLTYGTLTGSGTISSAIASVTCAADDNPADVYSLGGTLVRTNVRDIRSLPAGTYIYKNKKVIVP